MSLTLLTYNIKNGGGERLDAVGRVIAGASPDLVAVQELRDLPDLSTRTGMRMYTARSWRGQPVGVLVARRLRVLGAGSVARPFHHAAAWVRVATPGGPLLVVSAHLFPYWGRIRRIEARWLADFIRGERRAVLMGDFNSLDPWTEHGEQLAALPDRFRSRHTRRIGAKVDTRAMALLARRGLVDLWRVKGTGPEWTAPTRHGGGVEFATMRLDYLLATTAVAAQVAVCRVVTGGEAESASDHYPVLATLATR